MAESTTTSPTLEELAHRLEASRLGGGAERIAKQHEAGKLTARERVELLLDAGSFVEPRRAGDAPLPGFRHGAPAHSR